MNSIDIKNHYLPSGYETKVFFIDEKPLYEYLIKWLSERTDLKKTISPVDDLCVCWTNDYDFEGDSRFMRYILSKKKGITPILSCPDDFDFSCIVIVADVDIIDNKIIWKRIGSVNHSGESLDKEKQSGILNVASYTMEDWELYGDNIALESVDSPAWIEWISKNWSEELYRRRINYTYPYYQDENNVDWIAECDFEFDSKEYNALIEKCYQN